MSMNWHTVIPLIGERPKFNMNILPSCFLTDTNTVHTFENAATTEVCSIFIPVIPVFLRLSLLYTNLLYQSY
jgi:hypothetical protein